MAYLPYSAATSYIHQLNDVDAKMIVWRKDLAYESMEMQQFNPFMGEGGFNCIQHIRDLEAQQGIEVRKALLKRISATSNAPYQGDYDTHTKEITIADTVEKVSLNEWRLPTMSGRYERKKPFWDYNNEQRILFTRYLAERKDLHIYNCAIGVDSDDAASSAIYSGEPPTNLVYPEGVTQLSGITSASQVLNVEQGSRAAEILEEGYSDSSTQVWVGNPPTVGGQQVRGVFFIHPYCKYDLRWDDTQRFESWLRDARDAGESNPIWRGIPDKFLLDGILYVTLRAPLSWSMLKTSAPWATGSDTTTPGTQVALNVYMNAQSLLRATAMEDIIETEDWDGKQFLRLIVGAFEGLTKTRYDRGTTTSSGSTATQANAKDYATVVLPCAAAHHNG